MKRLGANEPCSPQENPFGADSADRGLLCPGLSRVTSNPSNIHRGGYFQALELEIGQVGPSRKRPARKPCCGACPFSHRGT